MLERAGAEYMIGGSHAAIYYGEPRLTRDVDVIVALRLENLPALLRGFPPDEFYLDEATARVSTPDLDERYITEWSDRLGLRSLWEQIRAQV